MGSVTKPGCGQTPVLFKLWVIPESCGTWETSTCGAWERRKRLFLGPECLPLGLGQTAKQPWSISPLTALPLRLAKVVGLRLDLKRKNDRLENRVLGNIAPREWTFRNLGRQTNPLGVHIQLLKWGPCHSQGHPTLPPPLGSSFRDSGQHSHGGTDTASLPSPSSSSSFLVMFPKSFHLLEPL